MANRPERLVLVTGTGPAVGTTWVACRLARALRRRGLIVAARTPVQCYDPADDLADTGAGLLAHATGDHPAVVCPQHRWYPAAMAPPMAAEALGRPPFTVADLVSELAWPPAVGVGLVAASGGPRSPLAADGDAVALAAALRPEHVVLVADAGPGAVNGVRLAVAALAPSPVIVALNRFDAADDLHARTLEWLAGREGLEVVTDPAALVAPVVGWPA